MNSGSASGVAELLPGRAVTAAEGETPGVCAPTMRDLTQCALQVPLRNLDSSVQSLAGYELLGELGRGGMGVVYLARQTALNRLVALKMALPDAVAPGDLARFRSEAEAVARLRHPNIVQIHEVAEIDGRPFFSLEFCEEGSLERQIRGQTLPAASAARLLHCLAQAIQTAHEAGIVHRDLKPANILLQRATEQTNRNRRTETSTHQAEDWSAFIPKITDFGLAKYLDAGSSRSRAGEVVGTPSYMASEQASGNTDDIGPWTDVYALGAILYELLTGRPPFVGATVLETLQQVQFSEPIPPRRLQPRIPRDLETICLKCLAKDPRRRYSSAQDLASDLQRYLDHRPIWARPTGPLEHLVKWARRRPAGATLLAVGFLLVTGMSFAIPWQMAHLNRLVEESSARLVREQDEKRRADLRALSERDLAEGRKALTRPESTGLEDARLLFATALGRISSSDASADPELSRLQTEIIQSLEETAQHMRRRSARQQLREFQAWLDEAVFHLNRDAVDGPQRENVLTGRKAAEQALRLIPEDSSALEPSERERLRAGRIEALVTLAEATFRPDPGDSLDEQRQRIHEALDLLDKAEKIAGPFQAIHRRRARYLEQMGDHSTANEQRRRAESLRPRGALDWFLSGHDRWLQGDAPGALRDLDRALRIRPDLFWPQFFRALALQKLKKSEEARVALTLCIGKRPDFVWLYLLRAHLHIRGGDLDSGEADLRTAEELHPDSRALYVLHLNRATLDLSRQRLDSALAHLEQALRERSDGFHAYGLIAGVHLAQGKLAQAERALDRAILLAPEQGDLYRTRARVRQRRLNANGALADLKQAVRLDGNGDANALAWDHLDQAQILGRRQQFVEALGHCEHALTIRPDFLEAQRYRGELLLLLDRPQEALETLDERLERGQPDAEVYRLRGLARSALGKQEQALADYSQALELRPDEVTVRALRGWLYLRGEQPRLAFQDFNSILQNQPEHKEALAGRAAARVRLQEPREALADAAASLRGGVPSPRLLYNAARVTALASQTSSAGLERSAQETHALELLRSALAQLPPSQRAHFWRETVRKDSCFRNLTSHPDYLRLEQRYSASVH